MTSDVAIELGATNRNRISFSGVSLSFLGFARARHRRSQNRANSSLSDWRFCDRSCSSIPTSKIGRGTPFSGDLPLKP